MLIFRTEANGLPQSFWINTNRLTLKLVHNSAHILRFLRWLILSGPHSCINLPTTLKASIHSELYLLPSSGISTWKTFYLSVHCRLTLWCLGGDWMGIPTMWFSKVFLGETFTHTHNPATGWSVGTAVECWDHSGALGSRWSARWISKIRSLSGAPEQGQGNVS